MADPRGIASEEQKWDQSPRLQLPSSFDLGARLR